MLSFSPSPEALGIDPSRPPQERYRILGQIASGGMSEIYIAHMDTGEPVLREVVLKRLRPELQAEEEFVHMFYDEARIASQMRHPSIVQIYELGELDGSLFIAMEPVPGVTLRDLITRLGLRRARLPIGGVLRVACDALDALAYAHTRTDDQGLPLNIVHRDVSPQNILVAYEGKAKLLDFGVAKAERKFHKTLPGLVKGKFAYMAPEQIRGLAVDARADLFALGETLYEAVVGRHPFPGMNDAAVLSAIMNRTPTDPRDVDAEIDPDVRAVLLRALEKDPKARYASASEMREDIQRRLGDRIATQDALGAFVCQVFSDSVAMLREARERGDDDLLVEALRVQDFAEAAPVLPPPALPSVHYSEVPTMSVPRTIVRNANDPSEPATQHLDRVDRVERPHSPAPRAEGVPGGGPAPGRGARSAPGSAHPARDDVPDASHVPTDRASPNDVELTELAHDPARIAAAPGGDPANDLTALDLARLATDRAALAREADDFSPSDDLIEDSSGTDPADLEPSDDLSPNTDPESSGPVDPVGRGEPSIPGLRQLRRGRSGAGDEGGGRRAKRRAREGRPLEAVPRKLRDLGTGEHDVSGLSSAQAPALYPLPPRAEPADSEPVQDVSRLGRYVMIKFLRPSGNSELYLARQAMSFQVERSLVIKRLAPERAQEQSAVDALIHEGRLLARLSHPGVIQLIEIGVHRSEPFLALEYVDGWSLREVFTRVQQLRREFPLGLACRVASDVLAALAFLHTAPEGSSRIHPVLHRDLAPEHLLITRYGVVKLADFDVATEIDAPAPPAPPKSASLYVAPGGRPADADGVRADIYAAGVIFLESLLQEVLPDGPGELAKRVSAAADGSVLLPAGAPAQLPSIALRALHRNVRDRYASAHGFQVEVERLIIQLGQPVTPQHLAAWLQRLFAQG